MPLGTRTRRFFIALLLLVAAAPLAWLGVPLVLASLAKSKLVSAAQQVGLELRIGVLEFEYPLGLRARNVRVLASRPSQEMLYADSISLALKELPWRSGPLQIDSVVVERPTIRVSNKPRLQPPGTPPKHPMSLSDVLRIQRLSIRDGRVSFADGQLSGISDRTWQHINTELRLSPSSSKYRWEITADSSPILDDAASGSFDPDVMELEVADIGLNARFDANSDPAALPAPLVAFLRAYAAQSTLMINARGRLPLRDADSLQFEATVRLPDAQARVWDQPIGLNAQFRVKKPPHLKRIEVEASQLAATVANGSIDFSRLAMRLGSDASQLQILSLSANVAGVSYHPSGFERAIESISGLVQVRDEAVVAERVTAHCGNDTLENATVRMNLKDLIDGRLKLSDFSGDVTFKDDGRGYPRVLGGTLPDLAPAGTFRISGQLVDSRPTDPYDFIVQPQGAAITLVDRRLRALNLRGELLLNHAGVSARNLLGQLFDGTIAGMGRVDLKSVPPTYRANLSWQQLDVAKMAATGLLNAPADNNLSGRLSGNASAQGTGGDFSDLTGTGELTFAGSYLWDIPILAGVVDRSKFAHEALTAGEAAAVFRIRDQAVQFSHAALSSPAIGLHGSGSINFDGRVELDVAAFPLGDWDRHIRETGIPLVSDVGGGVAGTIQRLLGAATRQLLFRFRVRGSLHDPHLETIPSPILTDSAAAVLGQMLKREGDLLEELRRIHDSDE